MESLNLLFYVFVLAAVIYAIYQYIHANQAAGDRVAKQPPLFRLSPKTYGILLTVIALFGIGIRLWQFGIVPGGFNQDGAMAAVDGKALAEYGTDRFGTFMPAHLYAWGYGQMSSLLSYMIALFTKLFGFSPIIARLPLLIASVFGGVFFYLFMQDSFGKNTALVAAFFVAINPWHIMQSRWALDCNLLPHFFMGGLYFLNRGLMGKKIHIYISMIFFALCMYCYGIAIYTIPPFLLAICIYYAVKKKIGLKDILVSAGIYFLIAWPFILTMMVNYFGWETISLPFVTIQLFSGSVRAGDILLFSDNIPQQFFDNIKAMLNTTILQKKDLPWNDIAGYGTMYIFSIPFMVAGIAEFVRTKGDAHKSLALFALLTGVWAGLLTNNVNVNRINIVYYGMMMFIVLGIVFVMRYVKSVKIAGVIAYSLAGVLFISTYFGTYADSIKNQFYYGFVEALEKAKEADTELLYITADMQGEGYKQVSEIMTLFYDQTDAVYFQGKTNTSNGKTYLPYGERFHYLSMDDQVVEESRNLDVAYVVLDSDVSLFNAEEYDIDQYGRFCAVIKKS